MNSTNSSTVAGHHEESRQVWEFFGQVAQGTYVDVGANHPVEFSQTWFLEQQGWSGILIEANPELTPLLRAQRPRSRTFPVAVGSPAQVGEIELHLTDGTGGQSSPIPDFDAPLSGRKVRVPLRTLDAIMQESGLPQVDFLSLDVEEMELDVLAGFDLEKWRPKLILIEDFFYDGRKHFCLRARGYKLIRRTGYNNWYVPQASPATLFSTCSFGEILNLLRKRWISGPLIGARRSWRRRQKTRQAT